MVASEYSTTDNIRDNVLENQFDTATFLNNISNILKGYRYDSESKQYFSFKEEALLNGVGAKQVLNEIEGRVQNINASSHLRRKEIAMIRSDIWNSLCEKLLVKYSEFDLKAENIRPILFIVDHNVLTFLSRGENGGFFKGLSNYFQRKETVSQTYAMQPDKKGGFNI